VADKKNGVGRYNYHQSLEGIIPTLQRLFGDKHQDPEWSPRFVALGSRRLICYCQQEIREPKATLSFGAAIIRDLSG
jgi:hypothetical protein